MFPPNRRCSFARPAFGRVPSRAGMVYGMTEPSILGVECFSLMPSLDATALTN